MNAADLIETIETACQSQVSEACFHQLLDLSLFELSWGVTKTARNLNCSRSSIYRWTKHTEAPCNYKRRPILKYLAMQIALENNLL